MRVITDGKVLPKPALVALTAIGWAVVLYLSFVILIDSWERSMFSIAVLNGQVPLQINPFIDRYTAHPYQTLMHTGAGMIFAVLGPLQFAAPLRRRFPLVHRLSGRIFLPIGILAGVAAFLISLSFPVWGYAHNTAISLVASVFMVFAFVHAFLLVKRRNFQKHREWMMRGFATGLGVALFRVGLEDVLPPLGFNFDQSWNIVMAASFPLMLGFTELWIRVTRPKRRSLAVPAPAGI